MIFWNDPKVERLAVALDPTRRAYRVAALERAQAVLPTDPTRGDLIGAEGGHAVRAFPIQGLDLQLAYRHVAPGIVQLKVDIPRPPIEVPGREQLLEQTRELAEGPEARLRAAAVSMRERVSTMNRQIRIGDIDEGDMLRTALDRESVHAAVLERATRDRDTDTPDRAIQTATHHLQDPAEARLQVHAARLVDGVELGNVNRLYVEQTLRRINDRDMRRDRRVDRDIPR